MPEIDEKGEADNLIAKYGNRAYWEAIQLAVIAGHFNDIKGERIYSAAAKELLRRGYHKFPKAG